MSTLMKAFAIGAGAAFFGPYVKSYALDRVWTPKGETEQKVATAVCAGAAGVGVAWILGKA